MSEGCTQADLTCMHDWQDDGRLPRMQGKRREGGARVVYCIAPWYLSLARYVKTGVKDLEIKIMSQKPSIVHGIHKGVAALITLDQWAFTRTLI